MSAYKIKKIKAYPAEPISWKPGIYLGMSMNNKMFKDEEALNEVIDYLKNHTPAFSLLVGDYLDRYNERIFTDLTEEAAIKVSLKKGNDLVHFFKKVADSQTINLNYNLLYTGEFLHRASYGNKILKFENLYKSHSRFRELINYTVDVFLRRSSEIKIPLPEAGKLCRSYLFEELSIFEILAEEGMTINIYPGNQLPIIKEIVKGNLVGVSEQLEKIQAIEIKFRPS